MVALSKIDKELESYNPAIEEIDSKVKAAKDKVADLTEKIANKKEQIESNNVSISSFEIQIKELKDKLDSIKKKQADAKNDREVTALSTEEHIAKDTLAYNNDEIERLNKINEVYNEELSELEESLELANKELADTLESVKSEYESIETSKATLYKARDEQTRAMDGKILSFYEKIKNWAGNSAVVPVRNQACYGCYMKINDKSYSDLIRGEDIVTCPHCGRVLYIEVDSENA